MRPSLPIACWWASWPGREPRQRRFQPRGLPLREAPPNLKRHC